MGHKKLSVEQGLGIREDCLPAFGELRLDVQTEGAGLRGIRDPFAIVVGLKSDLISEQPVLLER